MAARSPALQLLTGVLLWLLSIYVAVIVLQLAGVLTGVSIELALSLCALGGLLLVLAMLFVDYFGAGERRLL